MPTPIRKKGMKTALPTNSMRFIRGEVRGMSRFMARPARKAPMMGSRPAACARKAPKKTMTSTKTYCETLSLHRLKNQRPMIGKSSRMAAMQPATDAPSRYQKVPSASPVERPTITVSTVSASMSVTIVPPTAMFTALSRVMPSLLTMG